MGAGTEIAWTDDTINFWIGCQKVSEGCAACYAEVSTPVRVQREKGLELWGPKGARYETKSWPANLRSYARAAIKAGTVRRVFAQSLSDTFEDRPDLVDVRARALAAIDALRGGPLILQLLTKRPENVTRMVPPSWLTDWPAHVWIGATAENQRRLDERIEHLRAIPVGGGVRFLSVEPQTEAVNLGDLRGIRWVITGGESGPKARPFDLAWARSIVDQCRAAGVSPFVKQMGARPFDTAHDMPDLTHPAGASPAEWPGGAAAWPREFVQTGGAS